MESTPTTDSRRHLRYDVLDFAMVYGHEYNHGVRGLIVDLGLGGLAIRTKEPLKDAEKLKIIVGSTKGSPFEMSGVVRYCEARPELNLFAVGIQFEPATHEERLSIAKLINDAFQRSCQTA